MSFRKTNTKYNNMQVSTKKIINYYNHKILYFYIGNKMYWYILILRGERNYIR